MQPKLTPFLLASCLALAVPMPSSLVAQDEVLVQALNDFSHDVYQRLAKENDNLCVSPASISAVLLMAHAGARGKTEAEMERVLYLTRFDKGKQTTFLDGKELRTAVANLLEKLNPPAKDQKKLTAKEKRRRRFYGTPAEVRVVNAMWGQEGYPFSQQYVTRLETHYRAHATSVDFLKDRKKARDTINAWVDKETNGKIKQLIAPDVLQANTRLVLTNAIYFKGAWVEDFWKRGTKPADFHLEGIEEPIKVPTMHQSKKHHYFEDDLLQALQMRYVGGSHAMLLLLPKKGTTLAAFEKKLTPDRLKQVIAGLKTQTVRVALPKFKIEQSLSLAGLLVDMGMPSAFVEGQADFSGINDGKEPMWVSHVLHKTFIDVHEEGTEAAAATAMLKMGRAMEPAKPVSFQADRPFVFLLRDVRTGLVLFMGRVMDPRS
jgi:serpin B